MSDLAFRVATAPDVPAIVALVESAYRGESSRVGWTTEADLLDGRRTDAAAVTAIVRSPSAVMLLGVSGDEIVGCCQLQRRTGDICYFGSFAVQPMRQGGGIGAAMLVESERRAVTMWGSRSMQMTVIGQRSDLIAWYLRHGYAATGETRPFPYGDERFGLPRRDDLYFTVLAKRLTAAAP